MKTTGKPPRWMVTGLVVLALAAGFTLAFRPLSAYWLQQQGGAVVVDLSRNLPPESGGFACLADPFKDEAVQAQLAHAISQLEQASNVLPQQAHLYYLLGRAYCMAGQYDLAVQALPEFTALRPKNPQADLEIGFALEKLCPPRGECEGLTAAQVWQRAGVLPEHLIANGEAARKKEDFAQAMDWYQRAEAMGADLRSTLAFTRYQAALKEGREQEAYAALKEAVNTDAGWANADLRLLGWYYYGRFIYLIVEDYPLAEKIFLEAISYYREGSNSKWILSELYRNLAAVENQQKKINSALFSLLKSLEINPQNEWAIIALGKIVFDQSPNDIQKVDSYFKRAVEINLHNINVWRSIITFWQSKNQEQKVDEYCAFALKNNIPLEECKY